MTEQELKQGVALTLKTNYYTLQDNKPVVVPFIEDAIGVMVTLTIDQHPLTVLIPADSVEGDVTAFAIDNLSAQLTKYLDSLGYEDREFEICNQNSLFLRMV